MEEKAGVHRALRRDPEGPGRGHPGQHVEQVVGLLEGGLELDSLSPRLHLGAPALERDQRHLAARAEGPVVEVVAAVGVQQRLLGGQHAAGARAAGRAPAPPWRRPRARRSPAAPGAPGPTFTITPTSGSATATSSAICSSPRMAISSTSASVSGGASRIDSGSPISVFRFWRLACVRRWGVSRASRMSLVEVLPVEPVMPTTGASSSRRHARASAWSAASGSGAVSSAP